MVFSFFFHQRRRGEYHDRNSNRDEVERRVKGRGGNVWVPFRNEEMKNPDFGIASGWCVQNSRGPWLDLVNVRHNITIVRHLLLNTANGGDGFVRSSLFHY